MTAVTSSWTDVLLPVSSLACLCVLGLGTSLVLSHAPWFGRRRLADRLRPYLPTAAPETTATSAGTAAVLGPLLNGVGRRLARLGGRGEVLRRRLQQAGDPADPAAFRLRQLAHAAIGTAGGAALTLAAGLRGPMALVVVVAPGALWALVDEQDLERRARRRTGRIQLELPVVAEQLGILIAAGYSLPSALARVGSRGTGLVSDDLAEVGRRIRHGVGEEEALAEWSARTDVPGVRRLVGILALHREAGDLGRLITDEARAIRAETHRDLIALIERRGQLVWIPVTLATLVPGLLLLAVPFVSAITQVTGG